MIQTILFDVDGVFLSEEHYFDASALTVWELLMSENYLGLGDEKPFQTDLTKEQIASIRSQVFMDDQVLNELKSRGMNANWDMIDIAFSVQLIHLAAQLPAQARAAELFLQPIDRETLSRFKELFRTYPVKIDFNVFLPDFDGAAVTKQELIPYLNQLVKRYLGVQTAIFQPKSALWHIGEHCSQEWYVGDSHVLQSTGDPSVQLGKRGFLSQEETLTTPESIIALLQSLDHRGITIGIATGRPALETYQPFKDLGWLSLLDSERIATADDVLAAEHAYHVAPLAKPHPFTYLLAYHGQSVDKRRLLTPDPEMLAGSETLIVGDSLADLLCARQMGCKFAGVLTGLSGEKARRGLEAQGADFILDSVADVGDLVETLNSR
ncbi:MAG: HAD hydrolase-like protein [Sporolactobacillus sp.]